MHLEQFVFGTCWDAELIDRRESLFDAAPWLSKAKSSVRKRTTFDSFQQKWDKFDRDEVTSWRRWFFLLDLAELLFISVFV